MSYYDNTPALHLRLYWYVCALYKGFCVDRFVYVIEYYCYLYLILGIYSYISLCIGY